MGPWLLLPLEPILLVEVEAGDVEGVEEGANSKPLVCVAAASVEIKALLTSMRMVVVDEEGVAVIVSFGLDFEVDS